MNTKNNERNIKLNPYLIFTGWIIVVTFFWYIFFGHSANTNQNVLENQNLPVAIDTTETLPTKSPIDTSPQSDVLTCNGKQWLACPSGSTFLCPASGDATCQLNQQSSKPENPTTEISQSNKLNKCLENQASIYTEPMDYFMIKTCADFGYTIEDYNNGYCQLPYPDVSRTMMIRHKQKLDGIALCHWMYGN